MENIYQWIDFPVSCNCSHTTPGSMPFFFDKWTDTRNSLLIFPGASELNHKTIRPRSDQCLCFSPAQTSTAQFLLNGLVWGKQTISESWGFVPNLFLRVSLPNIPRQRASKAVFFYVFSHQSSTFFNISGGPIPTWCLILGIVTGLLHVATGTLPDLNWGEHSPTNWVK